MWCDMTNSRIDMMRAPYTDQVESQVYTDTASDSPAVSDAIPWPEADEMPEMPQYTVIEYRLNAIANCESYCDVVNNACDGINACDGVNNAINWLEIEL